MTPIAVPKHYVLIDVITPMIFPGKGRNSNAYINLIRDMDEMVVSDLEYLEEEDIMNWPYLNIVIRKKLIIVLKYFKLKQHLVQD